MTWTDFNALIVRFPLPEPRTTHVREAREGLVLMADLAGASSTAIGYVLRRMRAQLGIILLLSGCGGTIQRSKPRVVVRCEDCRTSTGDAAYAVGTRLIVDPSWSGLCENPRIGVEGGGDKSESCNTQVFDATVTCNGVRCDIERRPNTLGPPGFVVMPREAGTLDLAIRFMPRPEAEHQTIHQRMKIVTPDRTVVTCTPKEAPADPIAPQNTFLVFAYAASDAGQTPLRSGGIRVEQLEPEHVCSAIGTVGSSAIVHGFACDHAEGETTKVRATFDRGSTTVMVRRRGARCEIVP